MIYPQLEIQIIASLVAIACAVPGVFLVLRKMAMISDAISHSILLGIVIGFFITTDLNSPLLIFFAALTGVLTVVLVEYIQKTGLVKEDTAIGLVFPALFSIGIILISKNAADIHLDIDAVLLGELAFTPFERITAGTTDLGPKSMWTMGSIAVLILILLFVFFKEIKLSTFDPQLAAAMGFSPALLHYGLMSVSSVTIVGAFDAVGAILVIALIIAPAATAYLLTDNLKKMIGLSMFFGVTAAVSGYWFAGWMDVSIAGSIASTLGIFFLISFLTAPKKGFIAVLVRQRKQRLEVSMISLLLHLNRHTEISERHRDHLQEHINWNPAKANKILKLAKENDLLQEKNNVLTLTNTGRLVAEKSLRFILENKDDDMEQMKKNFHLFR